MKVRFLTKWRGFEAGDETEIDAWLVGTLVDHRVVECVESAAEVECATESAPENAMANPKPRKRKRAPRKKKEGE